MDKRIEEGTLLQHEGGITCLEYYKDTHFLSGSLDGNICIWNSPKFQCLQILKAHKLSPSYLLISLFFLL